MTNKECWQLYTNGLSSPQSFIDWSWRFVVASSLQRRVAYNGDPKTGYMPCYPNMYMILVGRAGVGKGIVIGPATELLRFHKKKDFTNVNNTSTEQEVVLINSVEKANMDDAEATTQKLKRGGEKIEPTLFPYAADATTYEALVEDMSNSFRRINFKSVDSEGKPKLDIYGHCSMYFSLSELGSLFRKRTDDVVNYLLGLYDCPLDYEYKTKTKGKDRVRRGCLNILAGTTPEFMETVFNTNLIDQGFSSRAFFVYAPKNRKHVNSPEPLTEEQKTCRVQLLAHLKELAKLYGECKVEQSTREWLQTWWHNTEENRHLRSNTSPKLDAYYARKNIHVIKVAMAEHFSESSELFIPLERFQEAIEILEKEEKFMHMALTFEGKNPLAKVTDIVRSYIGNKKQATILDMLVEQSIWKELPNGKKSLEEVLEYLIGTGVVKQESVSNETNQTIKQIYTVL